MKRVVLTIALVVMLVTSAVAPAAAASADSSTNGFAGLSNDQVGHQIPGEINDKIPVSNTEIEDRSEGRIMASDHAGDMSANWVVINEKSGAIVDQEGANAIERSNGNPPLKVVIQLSDDVNHESRRVTMPASLIEELYGYKPEMAYGTHESGEQWTAPVTYEDGMAIFTVPHFSTNTISFDGEITITSDPALNGDKFVYNVSESEEVSNFTIDITGQERTNDVAKSGTYINGNTLDHTVGGTTSTRNGEVTFTGIVTKTDRTPSDSTGVGGTTYPTINGNMEPDGPASGEPEVSVTSSPDTARADVANKDITGGDSAGTSVTYTANTAGVSTVDAITFRARSYYSNPIDIRVECGGNDFGVKTLPSQTTGEWTWDSGSTTSCDTITVTKESSGGAWTTDETQSYISNSWAETESPDPNSLSLDADGGGGSVSVGSGGTYGIDMKSDTSSVSVSGNGEGTVSMDFVYNDTYQTEDPSIDIGGKTVNHTGTLSDGATTTESVTLHPGSKSNSISTAGGSDVDIQVNYTEVTESVDPTIEVNGQAVASYNGTMSAGETKSVNADEAAIQNGTNTVNVTVSDSVTDGP